MFNDDVKGIRNAGEHFTAMDDEGPRVRIEAPGGRVVAYTDMPADLAQRKLEQIAGPFASMHDLEHRIRGVFGSAAPVAMPAVETATRPRFAAARA